MDMRGEKLRDVWKSDEQGGIVSSHRNVITRDVCASVNISCSVTLNR